MAVCDLEKGHVSIGCSRTEVVDVRRFGKVLLLLTCNNGAKLLVEGRASLPVFYS